MRKITFSVVAGLLSLVISFVSRSINLVSTIIDLCDNGVVDESYNPDWVRKVQEVLDTLYTAVNSLKSIQPFIPSE